MRKALVASVRAAARPKYIRFAANCDKVHMCTVSRLRYRFLSQPQRLEIELNGLTVRIELSLQQLRKTSANCGNKKKTN